MPPSAAILAVNAGSSSLKVGLFDAATEEQLADRAVEWGGEEVAGVRGHGDAVRRLL